MSLVHIPADRVPDVWNVVSPFLPQLLERSSGRDTVESLFSQMVSGAITLWCVLDGENVVAIVGADVGFAPSGLKVATILFCSGAGSHKWLFLLDEIEDWARANDCQVLEMRARKGWAKKLPDFKITTVNFEKVL